MAAEAEQDLADPKHAKAFAKQLHKNHHAQREKAQRNPEARMEKLEARSQYKDPHTHH